MLGDESVDLIVTSPPYPMVSMWDEAFGALSPAAAAALSAEDGSAAFEAMHRVLDDAWSACMRVLAPGGMLCINIGDATRSLGGAFRLYSNHARIVQSASRLGLITLPDILWRKPNNSPTKFMGSGMLPPGAYVTYEHEYILLLRKGGPRQFKASDRPRRQASAYFWEERNRWFSDLWADLPGIGQGLGAARARSGAYPLELPRRLISMFSLHGDRVLDPFAGTGTTALAALCTGRSSISIEREPALIPEIRQRLVAGVKLGGKLAAARLADHHSVIAARLAAGKVPKHQNGPHGCPVVTRQEARLEVMAPTAARLEGDRLVADHACLPPPVLPPSP